MSLSASLEMDREIGNKQGEASDLGNIGLIYSDKGDLDQARHYLLQALRILEGCERVYGKDIIERAIAQISTAKEKKSRFSLRRLFKREK